jgi:RNA polymerase sigma-54 factor
MALSAQLGERGITPQAIQTACEVTFENLVLTMSVLKTTVKARDADRAKVEEAALVEKCLRQSQNTLLRLARALAEEQREFILGTDRDLKPLTRALVAKRLGVHESTISRAVSRKRALLPNGRIIPLSRFFDRSLSVRDEVRSIIAGETEPLTDTKVAGMLRERGIPVARRTIAKYRAMEGILPAALRKAQRAQRVAALSTP